MDPLFLESSLSFVMSALHPLSQATLGTHPILSYLWAPFPGPVCVDGCTVAGGHNCLVLTIHLEFSLWKALFSAPALSQLLALGPGGPPVRASLRLL